MPKGVYKRSKKELVRLADLSRRPRTTRGGGYDAIHKWLRNNYGKANQCESTNCKKISNRFHWCLRKECQYEHKKENFIQLCSSCHRLYDQKPEWIKKMSDTKRGRKLSAAHKRAISKSMKVNHRYAK